jgi:hypothetical protein
MKQIGAEWRLLSDDERQKYEEMARRDRERYLEEVHSMPADATIKVKKKKRVMRKKGDNPPKRVLTPYVIYVRQERPKMI